jgi:hypothetical protein
MLIRFCASNYLRSDGLVNGANGTFEDYINNVPILLLWIIYFNVQIIFNTRIKYLHMYEKFPRLNKIWTPIKQKIV